MFLIRVIGTVENLLLRQSTAIKKVFNYKGEVFFYYKVDFNSRDLRFDDFNLYFSSWICTVNCSLKIGAVLP